jgi:hypothetical protein
LEIDEAVSDSTKNVPLATRTADVKAEDAI